MVRFYKVDHPSDSSGLATVNNKKWHIQESIGNNLYLHMKAFETYNGMLKMYSFAPGHD